MKPLDFTLDEVRDLLPVQRVETLREQVAAAEGFAVLLTSEARRLRGRSSRVTGSAPQHPAEPTDGDR